MNILCAYGSGNAYTFLITKKHKPCCSSSQNKCPAIRLKNSNGLKQAIKNGVKTYNYYDSLPDQTKTKMAWSRGLNKANSNSINKQSQTRKQNYREGKFKHPLQGVALNDDLRWKRTRFQRKDSWNNDVILESKNEIIFAELCDKLNIKWQKPKRYKLSNGKSYLPDFYLTDFNTYTDPKSVFWLQHYNNNQLNKILMFEKEFKTKVIIFWDYEIINWEKMLLQIKNGS